MISFFDSFRSTNPILYTDPITREIESKTMEHVLDQRNHVVRSDVIVVVEAVRAESVVIERALTVITALF